MDLVFTLGLGSASHAAQVEAQVSAVREAMAGALATVSGTVPPAGLLASQLPTTAGHLANPHRVGFFTAAPSPPLPAGGAAAALARVNGCVHGRAFVLAKSEVAAAVDELRRDVTASLAARIPLLLEQIDDDDDDETGSGAGGSKFALDVAESYGLPRRAHVDVGGGLSLCDYLTADDEPSDCAERFAALLAHEIALPEGGDVLPDVLLGPEATAAVEAGGVGGVRERAGGRAAYAASAGAKPSSTTPAHTDAKHGATAGGASPHSGGGGAGLWLPITAAVGLLAVAAALFLSSSGADGGGEGAAVDVGVESAEPVGAMDGTPAAAAGR